MQRTVAIRDAAGMQAQLEHRTRDGWVACGLARTVGANGKVVLGSRNDTRNDRTHRVVVHDMSDYGRRPRVVVSDGTWKVRNR